MVEKIIGKFKKYKHFGFIIPENKEEYGTDFFVNKNNCKNANDGDTVTGHILIKSKGKKPEAKIVSIGIEKPKKSKEIIGIYSEHKGLFGFVDVKDDKGYFVFKKDNACAKDGDKVEAKIKIFKGKEEAVITKILKNNNPLINGIFSDQGNFGFVKPKKGTFDSDIFIAGAKKREAKDGDKVLVQIIKENGRRPEGVIREIIKE